jgi:hypothetical protein
MSGYTHERGRCPVCGRRRSVNRDGKLRRHPKPGTNGTQLCAGSGQRPA